MANFSPNFLPKSSVETICGVKTLEGMTKKQKYLEEVEKLYVEKQLTLREIAAKVLVGYSTLRTWKEQEDWDRKKKDFLLAAEAFHLELYKLAREMSAEIRKDIREGVTISPARYYALGRIMDIVDKTHKYEEKVHAVEKSAEKDVSLKTILKTLNKNLFSNEED